MMKGGIFPAIYGTVLLVLIMSVAAVPFGTITAIYLTEYAHEKSIMAQTIRFAVRTLATVPSIIFGLFGLGFFIKFVGTGMDDVFLGGQLKWGQPNILWASLTMALLTLPVVIVSVEEAIRTVPREMREASLALGATKWETIKRIVLPGSRSGIMTGTILAVSRGAGEVAPILFTGAAYYLATLPTSLSDQFMNLGYHIYIMATLAFLRYDRAIVFPVKALQVAEVGPRVLVVETVGDRTYARVRDIEPLSIQNDEMLVRGGLSAGDQLIVSGAKGIVDGEEVRVVVSDGKVRQTTAAAPAGEAPR